MAHLALSLLGPFQATLDGDLLTDFKYDKVRALLAYLAVESERPQRRETLTGLLWPDTPERAARTNLRNALACLRTVLGERHTAQPFLLPTRDTIQFNTASDYALDVQQFEKLAASVERPQPDGQPLEIAVVQLLENAVSLYRGPFLDGFSLADSAAFEQWAALLREHLQRRALDVLGRLTGIYEQQGDLARALAAAWKREGLEPWREDAQHALMRLLALSGQRSAALAQYATCCRLLEEELGVSPSRETTRLYEQIRDGQLAPPTPLHPSVRATPHLPDFLMQEVISESPVFVARKPQLARLDAALDTALQGQGHVVFVTGEAGQGKTALMQVFVAQALAKFPDLVAAKGHCNAYTGIGDPYLPFREELALLSGAVEAPYNAGVLTQEHARRLWNLLPVTLSTLVTDGPALLNTLVPGPALLQRAAAYGVELDGLRQQVQTQLEAHVPGAQPPRQDDLFAQVTAVLHALARHAPLLLLIDDLQWADAGSIGLLFHLGRRLTGHRILVVGAYRSEEVTLRPDGERHPLLAVVHEFQRAWGDIEIALDQAEGEAFVQAFLDSELHCLDTAFQQTLTRQTEGHPLFTVELLRGMQERGDLVQDATGNWVVGSQLDWATLPARVEAVIAERVERLPASLQALLRVASVEGETFTAEAVAQVQQADPRETVAHLSGPLRRRHRLVRADSLQPVNDQRLSRYRFRHILFQTYVYSTLDHVERAHLHAQVGTALEMLHGDHTAEIAPQLAVHFERAGLVSEAADYYRQAGERAIQMSANAEAIDHLNKGIDLLNTLPPSPERDERELAMQFAIIVPIMALKSWGALEARAVYDRAMELSQILNDTPKLLQAMILKQYGYTTHAEHRMALEVAEQFYALAQPLEDSIQTMLGHQIMNGTCMFVGQFARSLHHGRQLMALYDLETHRSLAFVLGQDPAVCSQVWMLYDLWYLGYPDQALALSQRSLAFAQDLDHAFSTNFIVCFKSRLHRGRREVAGVQELVETQKILWNEHKFELAKAGVLLDQAWVLSEQGYPDEAVSMYEEGLAAWKATGMLNHRTEFLCVLSEMYGRMGNPARGLELIGEAIAFMKKGDERYHEAELYRMRGLLRLQMDKKNAEEAEADFHTSIAAARRMEARMCELRTTVCLARLWQQQGKHEEAYQVLAAIYGWFTEGFETRDLQEAQALLGSLVVT